MSILEPSDKRLSSYFKRLAKFNGSAQSKSDGDEHRYPECFLNFRSFLNCSEEDFLDPCSEVLKKIP